MTTPNDGGHAFPTDGSPSGLVGMTLRDYFAAAALQGDLASESENFRTQSSGEGRNTREQNLALNAYKIADAMLAERTKGAA